MERGQTGGATDIVVNDSQRLDGQPACPRSATRVAVVVKGQKPWSMLASAALTCGAVRRRPLHQLPRLTRDTRRARSSTTYSIGPTPPRLGGRDTGEYGFNAAVLGAWGTPGSASWRATTRSH